MKLAIIKDGPFLPIKDGASARIYNLCKEYQKNGIDVLFVLIDRGWVKTKDIMRSGLGMVLVVPPEDVYESGALTDYLLKNGYRTIQTNIPELIILKASEWKLFTKIYDSHDVLYEQSEQRHVSARTIAVEKFIDTRACDCASAVFCCCERDKRLYIGLGVSPEKLYVVSNGGRFNKSENISRDLQVVFLGHLFYEPNKDAVQSICTFAKKAQDIHITIIGNYPKNMNKRTPHNVTFL